MITEKCWGSILSAGHLIDELNNLGERSKSEWVDPDEILELARKLQSHADTIWYEALGEATR